MPRRTEPQGRKQGPGVTEQLVLPMVRGALLTKALLREFVVGAGLETVRAVFREEAAELAGPKGRRKADRTAHHWGTAPAELVMGGRKVVLARPRVRTVDGRELTLPSVERFSEIDPLTERVLEQVLLGVSTRRYEPSLEPLGAGVSWRGTSKSAVSRRFVAATKRNVEEALSGSLEGVDLAVLMLDGIVIKGQSVVVALGINVGGAKQVLGIRLGSTENAQLCTELLEELLKRKLKIPPSVLCVIDGGGGLRRALKNVLGDEVLIQRCQVHKMRNLRDHLAKKTQPWVLSQMREAYRASSAEAARRQLQRLVAWLKRNGHEDAAASLGEGLEQTLTVLRLRLPRTLTRSLSTTNAIENLMSAIRRTTGRITRWRNGSMIRRWAGVAVLEAAKHFRRIKGHNEMPALLKAFSRIHPNSLDTKSDAA